MKKNTVLTRVAALAAAVVFGMSLTTTAYATSRTETQEVLGATRNRNDAGEPAVLGATKDVSANVEIEATEITDADVNSTLASKTDIAGIINNAYAAMGSATTVKSKNMEVLVSYELTIPEGTVVNAENPLYVTIRCPGVTTANTVYALHKAATGWEVVPCQVYDGYVVVAMTSFSPLALVIDKSTVVATAGSTQGSATAPRTGEFNMIYVVGFAAVVFMTAALAASKKRA